MTTEAPALIAGKLHGLREWRVEHGSLKLLGAAFDGAPCWEPHGQVTCAVCTAATGDTGAHEPPGHGCTCGLHAFHPGRASARRAFLAARIGSVVGVVEAWGRVEVHVGGFRAEFGRPCAFVCAPDGEARADVKEIAAHHNARVLTVEDGEDLYEHCQHSGFGIAEQVLEESFGPAFWAARLRELTYWSGSPTWPPNMNAAERCSLVLTPGDLVYEFKRQRAIAAQARATRAQLEASQLVESSRDGRSLGGSRIPCVLPTRLGDHEDVRDVVFRGPFAT